MKTEDIKILLFDEKRESFDIYGIWPRHQVKTATLAEWEIRESESTVLQTL